MFELMTKKSNLIARDSKDKVMREFVIGDIHGGHRALVQVLKKASFDYDNDKLIAVGDVCDGWPDVAESIEELRKIKNLIYLMGNHDEWAIRFLEVAQPHSNEYHAWRFHGGISTYESYLREPGIKLRDTHTQFLKDALPYYLDDQNRLFMHAGFVPEKTDFPEIWNKCFTNEFTPEDLKEVKEKTIKTFYWDRQFWGGMYSGRNVAKHFNEVYIGHTPTINFPQNDGSHKKPMWRNNVCNMDTGACYTGPLSLMDINTKEVFQSEEVMKLYPNHPGRNGEKWSPKSRN